VALSAFEATITGLGDLQPGGEFLLENDSEDCGSIALAAGEEDISFAVTGTGGTGGGAGGGT
jgi:hypothetical protein